MPSSSPSLPDKYQEATRRALQGFAQTNASVYAEARRQVDMLRREITTVFSRVDLLVVPTMLGEPVTIADSAKVDAVDYRNTVPFNTYGLPAISIPCGFTRSGLPIGLQISGPPFGEFIVLALAHAYAASHPVAQQASEYEPSIKLDRAALGETLNRGWSCSAISSCREFHRESCRSSIVSR